MDMVESSNCAEGHQMKRKGPSLPPWPALPRGRCPSGSEPRNPEDTLPFYPTEGNIACVVCILLLSPMKCDLEIITAQVLQIHRLDGVISILQKRKMRRDDPAGYLRSPSCSGVELESGSSWVILLQPGAGGGE